MRVFYGRTRNPENRIFAQRNYIVLMVKFGKSALNYYFFVFPCTQKTKSNSHTQNYPLQCLLIILSRHVSWYTGTHLTHCNKSEWGGILSLSFHGCFYMNVDLVLPQLWLIFLVLSRSCLGLVMVLTWSWTWLAIIVPWSWSCLCFVISYSWSCLCLVMAWSWPWAGIVMPWPWSWSCHSLVLPLSWSWCFVPVQEPFHRRSNNDF